MVNPTFSGEVMLAGWAETHNSGAKIAFWLPDAESLDVFRGLTVRKGNAAGHRFAMVLVEIGDDEKPVEADAVKGGSLARLAGILCATPAFREWFWRDQPNVLDEQSTAAAVRDVCGVKSRAELDHNNSAAERFHELIRKPYHEHFQGASS